MDDESSRDGIYRWTQDYIDENSDKWAAKGLLWFAPDYNTLELHLLDFPQRERAKSLNMLINAGQRSEQDPNQKVEPVTISVQPKIECYRNNEEDKLKMNQEK